MAQPAQDISSLGFSKIDGSIASPAIASPAKGHVVEGYTSGNYMDLYKSMVSADSANIDTATQKKYGMTDSVDQYPSTHPEYMPSTSEKALNDSQQILNQQYSNMTMTLVTTAALGLIAIMITAGATE